MPSKPVCSKCNKKILVKQFLVCAVCKDSFDLSCTNYEKLFNLMDNERKAAWTCGKCRETLPEQTKTSTPIMSKLNIAVASISNQATKVAAKRIKKKVSVASVSKPAIPKSTSVIQISKKENIRVRRSPQRKRQILSEVVSDQESEMELLEDTGLNSSSQSLPNTSTIEDPRIDELKAQVSTLSLQLASAHEEIDRLNTEVAGLNKKLADQQKKGEIFKKLLTDKGPLGNFTPTKKGSQGALKNHVAVLDSDDDTPQVLSPAHTPMNDKKYSLDQQHSVGIEEIESDSSFVDYATNKEGILIKPQSKKMLPHSPTAQMVPGDGMTEFFSAKKRDPSTNDNLQILSSNNGNSIVKTISNNNYFGNFNFCHHIIPGVGITELFRDLHNSLKDMTRRDYCIVLIGDEDFHDSNDLNGLVLYIQESVKCITFTNVIVVCPTYICGKPMYNARVEIFNYLLLNSLEKQNACFFVYEPNLNLSYDMFSKRTGRLTDVGMKNVIINLQYNIFWHANRDPIKLHQGVTSDEFFRDQS